MSQRTSLLRQLYAIGLILIAIPIVLVTLSAERTFRRFYLERIEEHLLTEVAFISRHVAGPDGLLPDATIDRLCKRLSAEGVTQARVTVMGLDGRVIGDSIESPAAMDNHANRPEVIAALETGRGTAVRYSRTVRRDLIYVAIPLRHGGETLAVIRTARPAAAWRLAIREVTWQVAGVALLTALLALACWFFIASRVSQTLAELARVSARYAEGDFSVPPPDSRTRELAELADAMSIMARKLKARVRNLIQERNERNAMLACMIEGTLAVDMQQRIVYANPAADRILGMEACPHPLAGQPIDLCVRGLELQATIREALEAAAPVQTEVHLGHPPDRCVAVQGLPLQNADGVRIGALIMLQDITDMRRLENVRQQFVANVSHELKTPITSILGFVETLLDDDTIAAADRARFLGIIRRQAHYLNAIVNDLLTLSRLEHDMDGSESIPLDNTPLFPVLQDAVELCKTKADARTLDLSIVCDEALRANINPHLLEQALVNLIDNAVKYSAEGGSVRIAATRTDGEIVISVQDSGSGIDPRHIDRIFERFYRVDKGRSRELGGTGLGLAIVNHIARVHGGRVSVNSKPGHGSTFGIHLAA